MRSLGIKVKSANFTSVLTGRADFNTAGRPNKGVIQTLNNIHNAVYCGYLYLYSTYSELSKCVNFPVMHSVMLRRSILW